MLNWNFYLNGAKRSQIDSIKCNLSVGIDCTESISKGAKPGVDSVVAAIVSFCY